jgi:hypothetical protein
MPKVFRDTGIQCPTVWVKCPRPVISGAKIKYAKKFHAGFTLDIQPSRAQAARKVVRRLFHSRPKLEICGEAEDGRQAVGKAPQSAT